MHLEGSFDTAASPQVAWAFLLNPKDVAACLPDVQSLEVLSEDGFRAKVKVGVGLVKGNMEFEFRTEDKVPPRSAKLVGKGHGVGSSVELKTSFTLDEHGTGCKVSWAADVTIGGVMAGLGSKLLDSTSAKMVDQVVENFKAKLGEKAKA